MDGGWEGNTFSLGSFSLVFEEMPSRNTGRGWGPVAPSLFKISNEILRHEDLEPRESMWVFSSLHNGAIIITNWQQRRNDEDASHKHLHVLCVFLLNNFASLYTIRMHVLQATNLLVVSSQVVEVHLTSLGLSYVGEVFGKCLNLSCPYVRPHTWLPVMGMPIMSFRVNVRL
jgi:hypothetical protein